MYLSILTIKMHNTNNIIEILSLCRRVDLTTQNVV